MGEYGVPGDPAGMRKLAAALRRDAEQLNDGKGKVVGAFRKHNSSGPIVHSYEKRLQAAVDALSPLASRVSHLASELEQAAGQVERDVETARLARLAELQRLQDQQRRRS